MQWSWREGSKVRTGNQYVAPIDPSTGEIELGEGQTWQEVYAETRERFLNGPDQEPPLSGISALPRQSAKNAPTTSKVAAPTTLPPIPDKFVPSPSSSKGVSEPLTKLPCAHMQSDNATLTLRARINFERLKVSAHIIDRRHRTHEATLVDAGLDPSQTPNITLRHGLRTDVRFFARQNTIAVTVPRRGKGAANQLRAGVRRAFAMAKIHALESQKSDVYAALTLHGTALQQATRTALRQFLLAGNGRGRFAKALGMKLFGVIDPVRTGRSTRLPAAHLGLSSYGDRSDWREDTTLLLMEIEIHKDGYRGVFNATRTALAKARAAKTHAERDGFSFTKLAKGERISWGKRQRRAIRRAEARIALQQIRLERLNALREAFRL